MSNRTTTVVLGAVGVLLATLALSACAPGSSKTGIGVTQGAGAVKPVVGECWTLTYDHLETWADWKGNQPVDCSSPHQAYTYAVTALTGVQPKSWETTGVDPHMRPEVQDAASKACHAAQAKYLSGATSDAVLIVPAFYVATISAWKSGARWVRCDVSTIAIGSRVESPKLANLPKFEKLVNNSVDKYAYCIDAPGSTGKTGPFGTHTETFADCTASPEWSISDSENIPGDAATAYPGKAALDDSSRVHCGQGGVVWPLYPTPQQWATGGRLLVCWAKSEAASA
jgi:hypothetical protein